MSKRRPGGSIGPRHMERRGRIGATKDDETTTVQIEMAKLASC